MPIPPLDPDGYLPPGVHDCTIDEIATRFSAWGKNGRRPELCRRLREYLAAAEKAESIVEVVVDGSFATAVDEPNDVDLLVVVGPAFAENQMLPMVDYNLISKQRVRRRFAFDVLVARDGSPEYERYVEFFSRVRNSPDKRKGSLRVSL